jgi:hypothetical protein
MVWWGGYLRSVRVGAVWRVWVRRVRCRSCGVSHALLPSFCLWGRLDGVEVIGAAVAAVVGGAGTRSVARAAGVGQSTARGWCGRHRDRARLGLAVVRAVSVLLGRPVMAAVSPEALGLSAVESLARVAEDAEGLGHWRAVSLVSGGLWLAPVGPTRSRVYPEGPGRRLMALIDPSGERPP